MAAPLVAAIAPAAITAGVGYLGQREATARQMAMEQRKAELDAIKEGAKMQNQALDSIMRVWGGYSNMPMQRLG